MQQFYCNLSERMQIISAIWLHDGMWINHEVSDDAIRLAEASLSEMFSQGSRSKNPFLKLSPWQHTLSALKGNLVVLRGPSHLAGLGIMLLRNTHLFVFSKKELIQELNIERVSKRPKL